MFGEGNISELIDQIISKIISSILQRFLRLKKNNNNFVMFTSILLYNQRMNKLIRLNE